MVRIEDLTKEDVTEAGDIQLHRWRSSFCQVFEKRQLSNKEIDMMIPGYAFLTSAMRERGLVWKAHDIDMELFEIRVAVDSEKQVAIATEEEVVVDAPDIDKLDVSIISKSDDDDERIVFGVVYEPDTEDTQGDEATAEEIEKACYSFMENGQVYFVMHKGVRVDLCVLENYLAPVDFSIETADGVEKVTKGTWLLGSRIPVGAMWDDIKSGELTGYSMGGTGQRV